MFLIISISGALDKNLENNGNKVRKRALDNFKNKNKTEKSINKQG